MDQWQTHMQVPDAVQFPAMRRLEAQGVSFDPLVWQWRFSADTDVNYLLAAAKPMRRRPSSP